MTKRNLLLGSVLLVFGVLALVPCAMATTWGAYANVRKGVARAEGYAEATGQVVMNINANGYGLVPDGSSFTITYSAPVVSGTALVVCAGGGASPWATGCGDLLAVSYGASTVTITFQNGINSGATNFTVNDGSQVAVTVRINATQSACTPVTATVTAYSPGSINQLSLVPSTVNVGTVVNVDCVPSLVLTGMAASALNCIGVKDVGNYENEFVLGVNENSGVITAGYTPPAVYALTSMTDEENLDWGGGVVATNPPPPPTTVVTNETDFVVTFSGVPTGVGIRQVHIQQGSGTLTVALTSPVSVPGPTAGQITFSYKTTSEDNGSVEGVNITYAYWSAGPLPPGSYQITATVALSPTTITDIPYFTGVAEGNSHDQPLAVVNFYNCTTSLLYPFVTSYLAGPPYAFNNLGTEIFVANTTVDPLATAAAGLINPSLAIGTATPQSGTCTFWLFPTAGAFADGTAGAMASFMSPTIWAGGTYGFDMGSQFPGKTGYIYAICGFQNAHGVEYVTDNYALGEPGYAASWDAIVIPTPDLYHRTPAGDGLGESAVAPIAISDFIQQLLSFGISNGPGH